MPYAALQDLIERAGENELRQIADHDRDGIADADVIAAALEDAENQINGYVGTRYQVPLDPVPALVRTWAVSIARYVLHRNGAPGHVEADYKDAISALKDVAAKRIALPVAEGETAPAVTGGTTQAAHPEQVFTAQKLRGWK
jgi:phage gp36-like protein